MNIFHRVIAGASIVSVANVAERVLRLITAPILTDALGPVPYGIMALVNTLSSMGASLAILGIDLPYARYYWGEGGLDGTSVERFCWRFALLNAAIVSLCVTAISLFILPEVARNLALVLLGVGLSTFLIVAQSLAVTRRRVRSGYARIALAILLSGGCSAILSVGLVLCGRKDVWVLLWAALLGPATFLLVLGAPRISQVISPSGLTAQQKKRVIRLGLSSAFTAPIYLFISSSDRWFIQHYCGSSAVGIYSFAYNVGAAGILFSSALVLAWFPESLRVYVKLGLGAVGAIGSALSRTIASLIGVWIVISSLGGDLIRLVSHVSFHPGVSYVPWMAGAAFFYGLASLATTGLVIKEEMMATVKFWIGAAMVNLVGNLFLVPKLEGLGAAMAMCASYMVAAVAVFLKAQRRLPLMISWRKLIRVGIIGIAFVMLSHREWNESSFISLLYKLPAVTGLLLLIMQQTAPEALCAFCRTARQVFIKITR